MWHINKKKLSSQQNIFSAGFPLKYHIQSYYSRHLTRSEQKPNGTVYISSKNLCDNFTIIMAKQMKIIGNCPFCQREVGSDMRPINQLNMDHINILANELKDIYPSESHVSKVSTHKLGDPKDSNSAIESTQKGNESIAAITDTMLNMVTEQFERLPDSEVSWSSRRNVPLVIFCVPLKNHIPEDHAELILAMLSEEQHTYEKFLNKKTSVNPKPPLKRNK